MSTKWKVLLIAAFIGCLLVFGWVAKDKTREETVPESGTSPHADMPLSTITNGTEILPLKNHQETVLVLGTDTRTFPVYTTSEDESFANAIQADFLLLLVIDSDLQTITPIQISRDTMCTIPWLNVEGEIGGSYFAQIALAYNSGSGRNDSCEITAQTVSDLLYKIPVDHYAAFSMDGISTLNKLVNGVSVYLDKDLTEINPSFTKGNTVTLTGEEAEAFVRARKGLEDDTNASRMERQQTYLSALIDEVRCFSDTDPDFLYRALDSLNPYLITDLSVENISSIFQKIENYSIGDFVVPDGELRIGQYYELYLDVESLWTLVKYTFCETEDLSS